MLLIEAARCLGFGARVVTGYLYNPSARRRRYGRHERWGDPCMGRHLPSGGRLDRLRSDKRDGQRRQPDPRRRHPGHQPSGSDRRQFCRRVRRLSRYDRRCGGDPRATRRGTFGVIPGLAMLDRTASTNSAKRRGARGVFRQASSHATSTLSPRLIVIH